MGCLLKIKRPRRPEKSRTGPRPPRQSLSRLNCCPVAKPFNNRPFPSNRVPVFHSEAWCTVFHMKISFIHMFHKRGCAPGLALKKRHKTTWKWPISCPASRMCSPCARSLLYGSRCPSRSRIEMLLRVILIVMKTF